MLITPAANDEGTPGLQVTCSVQRDTLQVALVGDIDIASRATLELELRVAEALGFPRVLIDLIGVAFADSTAVAALLQARDRTLGADRELVLRAGPPTVQRVFELSGAIEVLTFTDDGGSDHRPSLAPAWLVSEPNAAR